MQESADQDGGGEEVAGPGIEETAGEVLEIELGADALGSGEKRGGYGLPVHENGPDGHGGQASNGRHTADSHRLCGKVLGLLLFVLLLLLLLLMRPSPQEAAWSLHLFLCMVGLARK